MSEGTVLFIDAYDSFSNNIIGLLRQELNVSVESIRIDDARFVLNDDAFYQYLDRFDAVVAGPGPGDPRIQKDIGLIAKIWTAPESSTLPALGICLGFQSLCLSEGAEIRRLIQPRHGIVTPVVHNANGIFGSSKNVLATQYHSLQACLDMHDTVSDPASLWQSSKRCPKLRPIAWDLASVENGPILMAVEHIDKPFTAVQFHPESVCTNEEGRSIICRWWEQVQQCNATRSPGKAEHHFQNSDHEYTGNNLRRTSPMVMCTAIDLPAGLKVVDLKELLETNPHSAPLQVALLQSGTRDGRPVNPETGRYSILGLYDDSTAHIRYSCSTQRLTVTSGSRTLIDTQLTIVEAFAFLETYVADRNASGGAAEVPFWGGLIGFISYEAGLSSIDVATSADAAHPDMWFVFVERSVIIDHLTDTIFIQSIRHGDQAWIQTTVELIATMTTDLCRSTKHRDWLSVPFVVSEPDAEDYRKRVRQCQDHLRAGSSYELCLTDQTTINSLEDPWHIYRRLSERNPAPFGTYLNFFDAQDPAIEVAIIGSSPERFLSWSRNGKCQFRPIKGTVSKTADMTREKAEAILRTQKEVAENLMIVDLIRHDLAGVKGVQNVCVPTLMSIEEYETVFQLVSVIEGDLSSCASGARVLAASLPPGSMTGAPKRRSCELLKELERNQPRSIYSGVLGYFDVGGGGDFAVVIRTAFKWKDEGSWRIGAGGAVTMLSTPDGEHEEMLVKRERLMEVLMS